MKKYMEFEIKSYYLGNVLYSAETESLKLCVELAVEQGANLYGANLSEADLYGADLYRANLCGADLYEAHLSRANLYRADMYRVKGVNKFLTTPLYFLQDQIGKIRAYKLTKADGTGPFYSTISYEIGKTYTEKEANCDEWVMCGAGISLATLDWCIKEWKKGYRIFIAEFSAKDIAAIPVGSDGKFRVTKCKIVAEKDLKEIGL